MMPIETVCTIPGRGTVVTGKVTSGRLKAGEQVEIIGLEAPNEVVKGGTKTRTCTAVEMFHKSTDVAEAGCSVGLLIRGLERNEVARGQMVIAPTKIGSYCEFVAHILVLKESDGGRATPFSVKYQPQFFIHTADITGGFTFPEDVVMLAPGDDVRSIRVKLMRRAAMRLGDKFSIREGSKTVGRGVITEIVG
jgi:elongation factor Tu